MGILYANNGKIYCNEYMEIYIPMEYFANKTAINKGSSIETFGLVYTRAFQNGKEGVLRMINLPVTVNYMIYEFKQEAITLHGKSVDVFTLQYLKDSYVLHQTVTKGRHVGIGFLGKMLAGKLSHTINYRRLIDIWSKNLEISGISFKVPYKIYEMIIAAIYRNKNNVKERYGQYYGRQTNPSGYDYQTGNVRSVVKNFSTFSGMVFEDMGTMITSGINNSVEGIEEPISPLEKIIHY